MVDGTTPSHVEISNGRRHNAQSCGNIHGRRHNAGSVAGTYVLLNTGWPRTAYDVVSAPHTASQRICAANNNMMCNAPHTAQGQ